ncbi:MAG: DUF2125 domain-containing protein [Alphaproteobacteria bacterium]|nr:DUF2125 domain-containing protein [Alphaproteobacteria bacterium]
MTETKARRLGARISFWLFAVFLMAVSGATASWFVGADLVRDRIAAAARANIQSGGSFTTSGIQVSGFPFAFDAHITDMQVSGRTARGLWQWQAKTVKARLSPWRAGDVTFDLAGSHKLRFRVGRRALDVEIAVAEAPGEFTEARDGAPRIVKVRPRQVVIRETMSGHLIEAETARLELYGYLREKTESSDSSAGLLLDLSGVTLPQAADKLLGRRLEKFTTELQVLGDLPLPLERPRLARWRKDGGVLEIKNMDLAWGPAKVSGNGTLSLDEALQPEASLAARISGHDKTVDALVAAGVVEERVARGVKLVLDMMSRRSQPGTEAEVRLPLSIQGRVIYVGPARLARLPMIRW